MPRTYISCRALGYAESQRDSDTIVIGFYGPKGGSRSIEEISRDAAESLFEELREALGKPPTPDPTPLYQCGICDHWHRAAWNGDCREDAERFDNDQINDYFGNEGSGWIEVPMPGAAD